MPSNTNDYYSDNDFSGSENMSNVKNVCKNLEKKNARSMTRNVDQKTNTIFHADEDTQYNTNNAHISNKENKTPNVADTNQSTDILQHSQNRPTRDRWLKF